MLNISLHFIPFAGDESFEPCTKQEGRAGKLWVDILRIEREKSTETGNDSSVCFAHVVKSTLSTKRPFCHF